MPSLDINDFRFLKKGKEEITEEKKEEVKPSLEEVEEFYRQEIEKIKKQYKEEIEKEVKKAFEEGYKKGIEEKKQEFEGLLESEIKKAVEEERNRLLEEFSKVNKKIENLLIQIKEEYEKRVNYIDELILSALEEILYYMYIKPDNLEFISKEIRKIVNQLKNSSTVKIVIPASMEEMLKDLEVEGISLEIDENIPEGNFIVEFDNIQLETNFKEKIKILKDEIKREIKKHSKV